MSERDTKPDDWSDEETTTQRGADARADYIRWCKAVETSARAEAHVEEVLRQFRLGIGVTCSALRGMLIGEVMKRSGGTANPQLVARQIDDALAKWFAVSPPSDAVIDDPLPEGSDS